jgi:hypothetical protein
VKNVGKMGVKDSWRIQIEEVDELENPEIMMKGKER